MYVLGYVILVVSCVACFASPILLFYIIKHTNKSISEADLLDKSNVDLAVNRHKKTIKNGASQADCQIAIKRSDLQNVDYRASANGLRNTVSNMQVSDLIESEEILRCRRFLAFVLGFHQREAGRSGYIRFSLDDEDSRFVMRAFVLGGTLEKFIKKQMDQKQCELLYEELDDTLLNASQFDSCLVPISSFHELNIFYSTSVESVCKIEFEQFIPVPGNVNSYFSAIERIVNTKYPGKFYKDEHAFGSLLS